MTVIICRAQIASFYGVVHVCRRCGCCGFACGYACFAMMPCKRYIGTMRCSWTSTIVWCGRWSSRILRLRCRYGPAATLDWASRRMAHNPVPIWRSAGSIRDKRIFRLVGCFKHHLLTEHNIGDNGVTCFCGRCWRWLHRLWSIYIGTQTYAYVMPLIMYIREMFASHWCWLALICESVLCCYIVWIMYSNCTRSAFYYI